YMGNRRVDPVLEPSHEEATRNEFTTRRRAFARTAMLCALVVTRAWQPAPALANPTPRSSTMKAVSIDFDKHPNSQFRIDSFSVPESARSEFEAAMTRNLAFLETLPGFLGHVVFEKVDGPSSFNIVTLAIWENREAVEKAGAQVRSYYERIGFDMRAELARWGVKAEVGNYGALREKP